MEYVDILDEFGNKTGETVEKTESYKRSLWHRVAIALIINPNGETLVCRRALTKKLSPGLWANSATGYIRSGEQNRDAIKREISEELGLIISDNQLIYMGSIKDQMCEIPGTCSRWFLEVFIAKLTENRPEIKIKPDEVNTYEWVKIDDLPEFVKTHDFMPTFTHITMPLLQRFMQWNV